MSKKSEILKIWQECFPADSPQWRRMFFDAAYVDDEALTATDAETGDVVSSLLLLPYSMGFHGRVLGVAYIYGAGTLRRHRAKGHMSRLIVRALREASERGDALAVLIPASPGLRRYYGRFGFQTVFFSSPQRFTSIHRFEHEGDYVDLSRASAPELYSGFEALTAGRDLCIQHTRAQFLTLMDDARLSGHAFAAVASRERICAMAWGTPSEISDELNVTEVLAEDADAAHAALTLLQRQMPGRPLTLMCQPSDEQTGGNLMPGGMARIVNPEPMLASLAQAHPQLYLTLRLTDSLLPENSGIYTLKHGSLRVADDDPRLRHEVNLDVTPQVLASLLFSSRPIGEITGLPAARPHMALMLD